MHAAVPNPRLLVAESEPGKKRSNPRSFVCEGSEDDGDDDDDDIDDDDDEDDDDDDDDERVAAAITVAGADGTTELFGRTSAIFDAMTKETMAGPTGADETNWLVKGRFLCGSQPWIRGRGKPEGTELRLLAKAGITHICSLTGKDFDIVEAAKMWEAEGKPPPKHHAHDFQEFGTPPLHAAVAATVDILEALKTPKACVYLHCRAGHGRTGVIAALTLGVLHPTLSVDAVMDMVQVYHDDRVDSWDGWNSPETEKQVMYTKDIIARARAREFPSLFIDPPANAALDILRL
jgi:hypothetical protein